MAIKTTTYGTEKDILIAPELAFSLSVIVGNTGVTAGTDGRKVLKAGTPLTGTASPYVNRQTVLTKGTPSSSVTCYGVLLHDVDVTDGNKNTQMLVDGYVDYLKLDTTVQTILTTAVQAYLPRILFVNGRAD